MQKTSCSTLGIRAGFFFSEQASSRGGNYANYAQQELGIIVRLNHGYGSDGTIPNSSEYDSYASECANFVANSKGANIWVIGNETNSAWERPGNQGGNGGQVLTPELYAQCFAKVRKAIKAVPGHSDDWLVPSAPASWSIQTQYPANPPGDWAKYFGDILNQCIQLGQKPDALAIHT